MKKLTGAGVLPDAFAALLEFPDLEGGSEQAHVFSAPGSAFHAAFGCVILFHGDDEVHMNFSITRSIWPQKFSGICWSAGTGEERK